LQSTFSNLSSISWFNPAPQTIEDTQNPRNVFREKIEDAQNYFAHFPRKTRRRPKLSKMPKTPGGDFWASSIFETKASFAFRKFHAFRGSIQVHKPKEKLKSRAPHGAQPRQSTSDLEKNDAPSRSTRFRRGRPKLATTKSIDSIVRQKD